jgi:hypothetical protein
MDRALDLPDFKTLCLQCREGLNNSLADFSESVSDTWLFLEDEWNIECFVCDIGDGEEMSLLTLYALDPESNSERDYDEEWDNYDDDSDDEDIPSLEDMPNGAIGELLVDGVD